MLFALGCTQRPAIEVAVLSRQPMKGVPSASGLEILDNTLYVIGDNSPWLFKMSPSYKVEDRKPIAPFEGLQDGVIPKDRKQDFEAMACAENKDGRELLIFGSGSKSPERDRLVSVQLGKGEVTPYSLEQFYRKLKDSAQLGDEDLNIEGAVIKGDELFLFNRGENLILKYRLKALRAYLDGKQDSPEPEVYLINLPEINGIKAGFSGAAIIPGREEALFTASVENTADWISDGEVLGSFVGLISLEGLKPDLRPDCVRLMKDGKPLNVKVESLAVYYPTINDDLRIVLVTDSDGGASELLEATLHWR